MAAKVGIVYLSYYQAESFLPDVVASLKKSTYPKSDLEFIIVHNHNPNSMSSVHYINSDIVPLSSNDFPNVTFLPQEKNLGFSGGCNVGIQKALELGCEYVYLHNNDGFAAANFLEPLVATLEINPDIGAAQSLMLMYPETDLINSAGNAYHFLGIGYCNEFRKPKSSLNLPAVFDSGYASGAALLLRAETVKKIGLLDEDYFLYHEDLEYSLRVKSRGLRTVVVTDSIFYHKYNFGRNPVKFYYIERNRWGLLLSYYRFTTLFFMMPSLFFWELGMLWYAGTRGMLKSKLRAYGYWLKPSSWKLWLAKRSKIQHARTVDDETLLKNAVGVVVFNEQAVNSPLLTHVANPLFSFIWSVIQKLI